MNNRKPSRPVASLQGSNRNVVGAGGKLISWVLSGIVGLLPWHKGKTHQVGDYTINEQSYRQIMIWLGEIRASGREITIESFVEDQEDCWLVDGSIMTLDIMNHGLSNLNLTRVPNLTELACTSNELSELDLSSVPNLVSLWCKLNKLNELDLSRVPNLKSLTCDKNQLAELNLSYVPKLQWLVCDFNNLSVLDLSCVPNLWFLSCGFNDIAELDLSQVPSLQTLVCDKNHLNDIDLSNVPNLEVLSCGLNNLSKLDLSCVPKLTKLYCTGNELKELDITGLETTKFQLECDPFVVVRKRADQSVERTPESSQEEVVSGIISRSTDAYLVKAEVNYSLSEENSTDQHLDASLTSFILSQFTSVRLSNCSRAQYLSSTTLRDALSDRAAVERECLKIRNFGKATLSELNGLLDKVVFDPSSVNSIQMDEAEYASFLHLTGLFFSNITLRELCAVRAISVRLANGIASSPYQDNTLGQLLSDWPAIRQSLRRQKNMGSKSIEELQGLCQEFVELCLSLNSISGADSRKIALSIFNREAPAKELLGIAITALSDAAPVSVKVVTEENVQRPEIFAKQLLALLDERSRDVVCRRFGFMNSGVETLEQIAQTYGVTRQRILQLEAKALSKLQKVGKLLPLRASLLEYGKELWFPRAEPEGPVSQNDTASASQNRASIRLLLSVCQWQLQNWLDEHARKWVSDNMDVDTLDAVRRRIADAIEGKRRAKHSEDVEIDLEKLDRMLAAEVGIINWEADEVACPPQNERGTNIRTEYRAIEVARIRVVSDQDGEWSLDDIRDH